MEEIIHKHDTLGEYSYTDTASTYNGTRRLKGQVNIKGIPVDVDYGDQKLDVITKIDPKTIGFEYSLTGEGKTFTDNKFKEVVRLYSEKMSEKMADIKKKSEENDKERDSKGFIFTVLAGKAMDHKPKGNALGRLWDTTLGKDGLFGWLGDRMNISHWHINLNLQPIINNIVKEINKISQLLGPGETGQNSINQALGYIACVTHINGLCPPGATNASSTSTGSPSGGTTPTGSPGTATGSNGQEVTVYGWTCQINNPTCTKNEETCHFLNIQQDGSCNDSQSATPTSGSEDD